MLGVRRRVAVSHKQHTLVDYQCDLRQSFSPSATITVSTLQGMHTHTLTYYPRWSYNIILTLGCLTIFRPGLCYLEVHKKLRLCLFKFRIHVCLLDEQ